MPSRRSPKVLILITLLTAGFLSLGSFAFLYAQVAEPAPAPYRYVKVQGRQVWVDFDKDGLYTPYFIRGVGYEPTPIGRHVSDWGWPALYPRTNNIFEETAALDRDFTLLRDMNANTIRIWKANSTLQPDGRYPNLLTTTTLTKAKAYGLKVIPGFWIGNPGYWQCTGGGPVYTISIDFTNTAVRTDIINRFAAFVTSFKNREEILFWAIGNEENLSLNRNTPTQVQAFYSLMNAMGAKVREIEGANYYHPVAIVNGELGFIGESGFGARDSDLPNIDIWGANVYRGENFGTLFTEYQAKSTKPLWLSEFGIDAFNAVSPSTPAVGQENQALQATWDGELWEELVKNSMVNIGGRTVPEKTIKKMISLVMLAGLVISINTLLLLLTQTEEYLNPLQRDLFVQYLFETVSALGTVGLSMGITASLNFVGKLLIIAIMLIGRVGLVTLAYELVHEGAEVQLEYAAEEVML